MGRPSKGIFIAFEGGEGCGKTTQIQLLAKTLEAHHLPFVGAHEPGGTALGESIRAILLHKQQNPEVPFYPETELLLFAASRAQLVREVIQPALQEKKIVLCDRFTDSTLVYQGIARHLSHDIIQAINAIAVNTTFPTLTFILDLPPEESHRRILQRNKNRLDRIESESMDFYRAVRDGYLQLRIQTRLRHAFGMRYKNDF